MKYLFPNVAFPFKCKCFQNISDSAVKNICSIMMTFPHINFDISRDLNIS